MPAEPSFGLAAIRSAVQRVAGSTSLHATADDIGMSYTGLRHFLKGGSPQARTKRKLVEWYVRYRWPKTAKRVSERQRDDLEAAMLMLASGLRAESSDALRKRRFEELVERLAAESGITIDDATADSRTRRRNQ